MQPAALMVARLVPCKLGAYERFMVRFAQVCQSRGLGIDFLFDGPPIEEVSHSLLAAGAHVSTLAELAGGVKAGAAAVASTYATLISSQRYRLVSFSYCDPMAVLSAVSWARLRSRSGRPSIIWHQHSEQQSPQGFASGRLSSLRLASAFMDGVCPVYQKGAEIMKERHIPPGKIHVLSNGVLPCSLAPGERKRVRREIGIADDDFLLFSASSLIERKNIAMMIRALAQVRGQVHGVALAVAGDGDELSNLNCLARELKIADRVRFLGLRNDTPMLAAASDLCLLTSHSEALPFFCLEAFAAGRTMIATSVGGVSDPVRDGVNGILIERRDHKALADSIVRLAQDSDLRRRFEHAACETYRNRFTLDHMVDAYFEYYSRQIGL
jgi:glycosyltransferase involved in cell wall biosynthesis